ncbi:ferredoxin [Allostreptomyces psammosilenae]|uniref:Ferredoxin n=1 Tax=Allostreptomyces psammosilenae TaxID=1892865 RepID=A0A852ZPJ0_9ACTN|nr:ferredoxin [Allostreptomyces psammosilenae]NYI04279.1 ferredoxin [Allostreptomyces psammosilenae]
MDIIIEEDTCVAAGQCVMVAPAVFDQSEEDGSVIVLDANPPESEHENVREAAMLCPSAAIRLQEQLDA